MDEPNKKDLPLPFKNHVEDSDLLLRRVPNLWITEDGTPSEYAYMPEFPRDKDGISVWLKEFNNSKTKLRKRNFGSKKHSLFEIAASIPRDKGYECINDHSSHILIDSNIEQLHDDFEALIYFCENSKKIYPE